jgi:hypothetical protein
MIVMCAWCQLQGRPAMLGEKEPRDTAVISHGICDEHALFVLAEARRSMKRPDVGDGGVPTVRRAMSSIQAAPARAQGRLLLIVSRTMPDRRAYFEHMYSSGTVEVIADRRVAQRRRRRTMTAIERRFADRRRRDVSEDMRLYGWALVRRNRREPR